MYFDPMFLLMALQISVITHDVVFSCHNERLLSFQVVQSDFHVFNQQLSYWENLVKKIV